MAQKNLKLEPNQLQGALATDHTHYHMGGQLVGRLMGVGNGYSFLTIYVLVHASPKEREKQEKTGKTKRPTRDISCMCPPRSPMDLSLGSSHTLGSTGQDMALERYLTLHIPATEYDTALFPLVSPCLRPETRLSQPRNCSPYPTNF